MTYAEIIAAWNAQADHMNQWPVLSEQEKVEWAWKCALEKAAKTCDDLPVPGEFQRDGAWAWEKGCDAAADAIRAMKDKP